MQTGPYRGRLRLAEDFRRLQWENGTPFIGIGPNIAWAVGETPQQQATKMEHWFAQLADNGGNHARIWLASWFAPVVDPNGVVNHNAADLLDTVRKRTSLRYHAGALYRQRA